MGIMRIIRSLIWIAVVGLGILGLANLWIVLSTKSQIYSTIDAVPTNDVALVLGTSNRLTDGSPNPYFWLRIERAAELYKAGKVKHILVSGDNSSRYYNEPERMRESLMSKGVPNEAITLDYAGLRTLDSIIRGKKIFGQEKFTIITQKFHAYRAVFISNYYNIEAVAMTTGKLPEDMSLIVQFREMLARPLAVWDLYIIKREPKYMGAKEDVNINN